MRITCLKRMFALVLLSLICLPGAMHAQSGRKTNGAGTNSGSVSREGKTSSNPETSNSSDEEGMINQGTGQGEEIEGDVLRVNTALVTVPVSVVDRNGKYIPDLNREDFKIFEEGIEQRVAYFATVDQPFTVALVIDTSGSTDFRLEDIQQAAITFVNQLKPDDRVLVISFDDQINVLTKQPTNDRNEIVKAIRRTRTGGGTRLYDAVDLVINQHLRKINGRKAMVLFTDGVDTTSRRASYDSTLREAEELDALIYPVAYDTNNNGTWGGGGQQIPLPGGRGGVILGIPFPRTPVPGTGGGGGGGGGANRGDYQRARMYLFELARRTGGRLYNGGSMLGISQAFSQIAEELRRQYSLGYYPKHAGQAGERRQIKVRVNQPNLVVVARDSYIYTPKKSDATLENEQQTSPPQSQEKQFGMTR